MIVVVLLNGSGDIFDVIGPFDTAESANGWADTQVVGVNAPVDTQFEIEHVSNP